MYYEEDQLRQQFFGDHPWELARPRIVLEDDGKDYARFDWSKMLQKNKKLDGERYATFQGSYTYWYFKWLTSRPSVLYNVNFGSSKTYLISP